MAEWRPGADPAVLRLRARMRERMRSFFAATGALEVDTPIAGRTVPAEAAIGAVTASIDGRTVFLRTSPESAMKRLLAAGVGDCWQLGPVFRDGERGTLHQPEFMLLEWYRLAIGHHELMDDVEALVLGACAGELAVPAVRRVTWCAAFEEVLGVDALEADASALRDAAERAGLGDVAGLDPDDREGWLDWLLAGAVVPRLSHPDPVFIHDWPVSQAALARADEHDPRLAARFELYWRGVELANGFRELTDPVEQRSRFRRERALMTARPEDRVPAMDERLLAALDAGLPDCAGVALGFDRLVMLAAGAETLDEVMAFSFDRA